MIPLPENVQSRALHWTPILKPTVRKLLVKVTHFIIVVAVIFSTTVVIISDVTIIAAATIIVPAIAVIDLAVDIYFSRC